ncbi:hypothetical protein B0920_00400 [Massilia sp. KIM]|uniref:hypothetical protein n=1 Tax=Massilia sp. KIM TaxID=1955422 RepID=UPI00098F1C72|nr:hypothetical protein [Massilia sp. KIM]OON61995.1 hypothetical protein B0920_00400 [Massilia sp. KIM]
MTTSTAVRLLGAAMLAGLLSACASTDPAPVTAPAEPTTSVAQAEERLAAVAKERAAIQARYAEREAVCYEKFFVNNCLEEAQERQRAALSAQRAIEIEASRFLRRNKVEERDKAIAQAEAEYKAEEAAFAANPPPAPREVAPLPPPRPRAADAAAARQKARAGSAPSKLTPEQEAANVRAFEENERKAEERQREVERRKAEREAKSAKRAEQEAKAKEGAAAAAGK